MQTSIITFEFVRERQIVMNLTLVRLLFRSHPEVSINTSGKMTESSIQSLWQSSACFLLDKVNQNNSLTQMVAPYTNERIGKLHYLEMLKEQEPINSRKLRLFRSNPL